MNTRMKLITRRGTPWFVRSPKRQTTAASPSSATTSASTKTSEEPTDFDSFLSESDPERDALEALLCETRPVATSRLRPRNVNAPRTLFQAQEKV